MRDKESYFPEHLEPDCNGLIAVGGSLETGILLEAYGKGIFPWSSSPQVMWYSPDPRLVIFPDDFHLSKSMRRIKNRSEYRVFFDKNFTEVMRACSLVPREGQPGTWITEDFIIAYTSLFELGLAHSVEVYHQDKMVGGLYGVSLGGVFFGESMFHLLPNMSKLAMFHLVDFVKDHNFDLIDCQVTTEHLLGFGAREIAREEFLTYLSNSLEKKTLQQNWQILRDKDNHHGA